MATDCSFFNFITWGVIGTIVCCFGFVGNMLSLVAFQRDRRSPTGTLLQSLASSDFMLLLSVFITDSLPYICSYTHTCNNPWYTWPYIRYIWILTPISHMCSIWFVVLIAVNRFWAVCKPHSTPQMWNNRRTPVYILGVVFVVVSFNIPRFFEYEIIEIIEYQKDNSTITSITLDEKTTTFGSAWSYSVIYKVMLVNILLIVVPIVLLIVFTILILQSLKLSQKRMEARRSIPNIHSTNPEHRGSVADPTNVKVKPSKSRSASDITFVLITVVIVAIVCQTPLAAFHFVRYLRPHYCGDVVFYLDNISKLLVNINSCVNFVIYSLCSPKFRTLLILTIQCRTAGQVRPSGTTVGKTQVQLNAIAQ